MSIKKNQWKRNISTLDQIAEDLYKDKNEEKYYEVMDILRELGLGMITMGDITSFIKREVGIQVGFNNNYIFNYIMNPENREKLMRYAESKFQYGTKENDRNHEIAELDFDDRYY